MTRLIRYGLPQFVDVAADVGAAIPPPPDPRARRPLVRCHGLVRDAGIARPRRCDCLARSGMLTCHNHRHREDEAQALVAAQKETA